MQPWNSVFSLSFFYILVVHVLYVFFEKTESADDDKVKNEVAADTLNLVDDKGQNISVNYDKYVVVGFY